MVLVQTPSCWKDIYPYLPTRLPNSTTGGSGGWDGRGGVIHVHCLFLPHTSSQDGGTARGLARFAVVSSSASLAGQAAAGGACWRRAGCA